ncbi:MAG: hypothetical protein MH137_11300 [Flavobacteriales bacterium]|nr:hypothetical protein [Flavobacteriales bacterium]
METYNNILCISGSELVQIIGSKNTYDSVRRNIVKVHGENAIVKRACYGNSALIRFDALPPKYKELVLNQTTFKQPTEEVKSFIDQVEQDPEALEFYSHYELPDGRILGEFAPQTVREYCQNAAVLNTIRTIYNKAIAARNSLSGGKPAGFWDNALSTINSCREELGHTLPSNSNRLRIKYQEYCDKGYEALVSGKFGNNNSRKVTSEMERLLLSLYTMPNKPFGSDVHHLYALFMKGQISVACSATGEMFSPEDFTRNGHPAEITARTVWNYLNNPKSRAIVDARRSGSFQFNAMHRPHHHRKLPVFSFSKISMDDRDLPRHMKDGKRVKAYYAYDVASGCVVGRAYSRNKDEVLFVDCMKDIFRTIDRHGFKMPMEVEVENHLVNKFFDDLALMFPFLRICNPGNSQEKHAEHLNRAKKYGVEKKTQNGIGRWYARHEAYRVDTAKVNDEFVEKTFTYERLVADDIAACNEFNNQLHPNQKKYPGKTRWQVLCENMNPNLREVSKAMVYRSIGERTATSIVRNQYVTVQETKFQLPDPEVMAKLQPGNTSVQAYYLPDTEGIVSEVYLYQGSQFICKAQPIVKYSTAKAEQTADDVEAYTAQAKYVAKFDRMVKEAKKELHSPVIIDSETVEQIGSATPDIVEQKPSIDEPTFDDLMDGYDDYAARAFNQL